MLHFLQISRMQAMHTQLALGLYSQEEQITFSSINKQVSGKFHIEIYHSHMHKSSWSGGGKKRRITLPPSAQHSWWPGTKGRTRQDTMVVYTSSIDFGFNFNYSRNLFGACVLCSAITLSSTHQKHLLRQAAGCLLIKFPR